MALEVSGIRSVPKWTLHRKEVDGADTPPIAFSTLSLSAGVRSDGFRWIHARWREIAATVGVKLQPLFADEESEQWIEDVGLPEVLMGGASNQISFEVKGRTFIIAVTAMSGVGHTISIDVSGSGRYSY